MTARTTTRADDERLLAALAMRACGHTTPVIAARLDYPRSGAVRTETGRVMRDDLAMSGEPARVVMQGYPWSRA